MDKVVDQEVVDKVMNSLPDEEILSLRPVPAI